jgi:hypothetical protein
VGRFRVDWTPAKGLTLSADGVSVVRQSTLYIVKAGWTGVLLDQRETRPQITDWQLQADGSRIATITLENADARCTYTLSLSHTANDDTFDIALTYRLKQNVPAEIEYAAAYLNGPLLAGATLTGNTPDITLLPQEIAVAPPAPKSSQEKNRLCPPFTTVHLGTRLGMLDIAYNGSSPSPVLFDARSDPQDWAQTFPVFWMGIGSPAPPVRFSDGERVARFRFHLSSPSVAPQPGPPETGEGIARGPLLPDAYTPLPPKTPLVIPTPKQMTVLAHPAAFRLNPGTKIVRTDETAGTKRAVTLLQQAIQEQFGLKLKIVTGTETPKGLTNALFIGLHTSAGPLSPRQVTVPQKPEGYGIHFPFIAGHDEAGVLWAAQTTIQLLTADDSGPYLPGVVIVDWPTLTIRGVHLFYGKDALPFQEKLIDRVFSRFKLNTLVIQAEQVRWQHDPSVAPSWAGTPEQIRQEVAYARERGITLYPLVQNYGHMEWLFNKPKNRDFAEDPQKPYALNFTNPTAVKYIEGFDAEADSVFNAPAFHIGLDEVTMLGRFPYRSAPRTFPDLFVAAAKHWHDFLARRGKETWMWADMTLHPSEIHPAYGDAPSAQDAAKIRAGLPKDIVMFDWQYSGLDSYPSLKQLKDAGFKKVIATTWYNPTNIQTFSRAAAQAGAWGALQTTWCGYESNASVLDTAERRQFTAMVLAAEYFWNGGNGPTPDKLPFDASAVFAKQWRDVNALDFKTRTGWLLHLTPSGTRSLDDVFGYGPRNRIVEKEMGPIRLADHTIYQLAARPIVLFGKLNPPGVYATEATIPLYGTSNHPVHTVQLLLTASHRVPMGTTLGNIQVTFTDGTNMTVPLIYGKTIASWDDTIGVPDAPTVLHSETLSHQVVSLRSLSISAPREKAVVSLKITSEGGESAPAVFAVTALE